MQRHQASDALRELNATLERRVEARTAELTAANTELEAFAYAVSHDLRAPLRSIDGFSQAIDEDYADVLGENGQDYVRRVRAASQRMGQLIDDLLGLSRVTRTEMQREPVDLSVLAHAIADALSQAHPKRAATVEWVIAPGLRANADSRLLQIALENLLGNAWKYTGQHARARIEIGMREGATEREQIFFVRDDGAGFDMRFAGRLFGAFQRLHSRHDFEGTGIGLATVRRIVNRHGGRIWANAVPEEGATFYFTLEKSAINDNPHCDLE